MVLEGLIGLLITLLVIGVILGVMYWILGMFPISQQVKNAFLAIAVLIILLWLLRSIGAI